MHGILFGAAWTHLRRTGAGAVVLDGEIVSVLGGCARVTLVRATPRARPAGETTC